MAVNAGMRNVPDTPNNKKLDVLVQSKALWQHTLNITSNEKVFNPKFDKVLLNDVLSTVKNIHMYCLKANLIRVTDVETFRTRMMLQERAIVESEYLTEYISLSRSLYHLRGKKATNWSRKNEDLRGSIKKWHNADKSRYKEELNIK